MSEQGIQNKYQPGDVVCAKENPNLKLVIRRYLDRIYFCKEQENPERKDKVYFERELVDNLIKVKKIILKQPVNDSL